jgi:acyl-CoA reductase-like NAD-dependent aldehyde dehydrogenase
MEIKQYGLIIGDEEVVLDSKFPVYNKFSGEHVADVSRASEKHVTLAVNKALETFENDQLSPYNRYEILLETARLIKIRKEQIAEILCCEVGKTISDARGEVERSIQTLILSAEEAKRIGGEVLPISATPGSENRFGFVVRSPIGVICTITPFNFPLNLACHKIGPALAAGNTVVWKPATTTPLSAYFLIEALREAGLPSGYVNLVCGPGSEIGDWLLKDKRIGKYTFTGSEKIGEYIKRNSGLRNVSLELGNNSPNIVHEDADISLAARLCALKAFSTAGQACISVQRIYVHQKIEDTFLEKLKAEADKLLVGDPMDSSTDIGPLISEKEADRVIGWINEAIAQGAKLVSGGKREGSIVYPTILSNVNHQMRVVCEEIFGPVLTVSTYTDIDEAINESNNTNLGLQSAIFTTNINVAMYAVKRLKTGGVIINDASAYRADAMPYGGIKNSGIGREGPRYAVESMTELKTVIMNL